MIGFGSSSALAAAYGIAVTLTMVITALLLHVVATERWKWPLPVAALVITAIFLSIDLAFFGANVLEDQQGGWLPLVIGAALFTLMTTWKTGRQILAERLTERAVPLEEFMDARRRAPRPSACPGTAVFMTAQPRGTPPALAHNLRHNKVLHEHVVVSDGDHRAVAARARRAACRRAIAGPRRVPCRRCATGSWRTRTFPRRSPRPAGRGLEMDADDVTYFLGRETIIVTSARAWRCGARSCSC